MAEHATVNRAVTGSSPVWSAVRPEQGSGTGKLEKAPYLKKVGGFLRYLERSVGALVTPEQLELGLDPLG